jgi:hypothetical protein
MGQVCKSKVFINHRIQKSEVAEVQNKNSIRTYKIYRTIFPLKKGGKGVVKNF